MPTKTRQVAAGYMMESLPAEEIAKKPKDEPTQSRGRFPEWRGFDQLGVAPAEISYTPVQLGSCCIRPGQEPKKATRP